MCGIAGYVSDEKPVSRQEFANMVDALASRGPDGRGEKYFDEDRVALGHRRLAIVDLSEAGAQPMSNEDQRYWLTLNGEIYNHFELRKELEAEGHMYRSKCDAETVVHAYEQWGDSCVTRLRGIFSFAIWDRKERRLFAARDHLGVKPFYYICNESDIVFCSQPKGLLEISDYRAEIDHLGFLDYMSYGVIPEDRACFNGMKKLPPAHVLSWRDGHTTVSRYWQVKATRDITDFDEAVVAIEKTLEDSISLQLMSDVPLGAYISGGIDSSLITAIASRKSAARITSFTIGFNEPESDERQFAHKVVEHCNTIHNERVLDQSKTLDLIDNLVDIYDEPYALGSAFPMICVAQLTQECGVKVVLAGDGADELFAGYRHYDDFSRLYKDWGIEKADEYKKRLRSFYSLSSARRFDPPAQYFPREGVVPQNAIRAIVAKNVFPSGEWDSKWRFRKYFDPSLCAVSAGQFIDLHTYLPDEILVKVDRATMAYGVEARVPFLDPRLVELAFSISPEIQYRNGERKALLKTIAQKWLPTELVTKRKKGFSIPLARWLRNEGLHERMISEVRNGVLASQSLLKASFLGIRLRRLNRKHLWQLYLIERWARRWIGA